MKKYGFSVTLAILWVVLLVAPVAAYPYEAGTAPGNSVSSHQVDSSSDGYVPAGTRTATAKAKATVNVNVYTTTPAPTPHYNRPRPRYTAPRPCAKRPAYHAPHHTHAAAPARPKAKPGKPFLTNKAGGSAFGVGVPNSTIAVTPNGVVVKVMKGIMSGKPGSEWQFATPGHTLPISRPIGSLLRFIVAVRNTDSSDLPTDGIFVRDDLASKLNCKAESGALFMGGMKIRDLSEDELTQLTSGVKIPVNQYVDTIPAKGTLGIRYDVRIAGGVGGSQDPTTIVPTDDNAGTGTKGPSWWSKIADSLKKFNWMWILYLILAFLLIWIARMLWQHFSRPRDNDDDDDDEPDRRDPDQPDPAATPTAERLVVELDDDDEPAVPVPPAPTEDEQPALTMEDMERAAHEGAE